MAPVLAFEQISKRFGAVVVAQRLDLAAISRLEFEAPDVTRFPALRLAYDALRTGNGLRTSSWPSWHIGLRVWPSVLISTVCRGWTCTTDFTSG